MSNKPAVEAAEAEATTDKRTFRVGDVELTVPRKWKRMKYLRLLNAGDLWGAMTVVFGAEQLEKVEDLDFDEGEFTAMAERLGELLGGTSQGN